MATATTPDELVRLAEHALTAARAAASFLAAHPDLPVTHIHACSGDDIDGIDVTGPLLEVQLGNDTPALDAYAAAIGEPVTDPSEVDYRVTTTIGDVTVWVTAWDFDDEPAHF